MKNLTPFRAALFDLDGTIFDSMGVWYEIDTLFLARRGIALTPDYSEALKRMNFPEAANYTISRYGLKESPEQVMDEWHEMTQDIYREQVGLKPFVKEYLFALHEKGIKLGVATSCKPQLYTPVFRRCGIEDLLDTIVTTEETKPKSFPDVYLEGARRLGVVPKECAVFEDIVTGIESAKSAGFLTVAVFDPSSKDDEEHLRKTADYYLRSFSELL